MSFDPFVFTPPHLDDLNSAVEHAQKAAVIQAVNFVRGVERPSSSEFASASRNGRHLTAIHRTLRTMGGPLFDPESPLTPRQRHDLLMRRVEKVQAAYADPLSVPASPLRCKNHSSPLNSESSKSLHPSRESCLVSSSDSSPLPTLDADYCPPDIENLLSLAELLAKIANQRWRDVLDNKLFLTAEDRALETLALRDITAIFRTLHRMSALAIAEDQTHDDLQAELDLGAPDAPASDSCQTTASPSPSTSEISDFKSDVSSSQSCPSPLPSRESRLVSSPTADEETAIPATNPIPPQRPVRPIPPVPEIRPVAASRRAASACVSRSNRKSTSRTPAFGPMSSEEEDAYLREEAERLKGFYPPGHISADDPAYGREPASSENREPHRPWVLNDPHPPPD